MNRIPKHRNAIEAIHSRCLDAPYEQGINTAEHIISRHGNTKPDGQGNIRVRIAGPTYHPSTIEWSAWHGGFAYRLRRRNERAKSRLVVIYDPSPEQEKDPRQSFPPPGAICCVWGGARRAGNVIVDGDTVLAQVWIKVPPEKMRHPKPTELNSGVSVRMSRAEARAMAQAILRALDQRPELRVVP